MQKDEIRNFVRETFPQIGRAVADDEPLFDSGMLDSFDFLKLLAFLERRFKVPVPVSETRMENFNTINAIEAFVRRKAGKK